MATIVLINMVEALVEHLEAQEALEVLTTIKDSSAILEVLVRVAWKEQFLAHLVKTIPSTQRFLRHPSSVTDR